MRIIHARLAGLPEGLRFQVNYVVGLTSASFAMLALLTICTSSLACQLLCGLCPLLALVLVLTIRVASKAVCLEAYMALDAALPLTAFAAIVKSTLFFSAHMISFSPAPMWRPVAWFLLSAVFAVAYLAADLPDRRKVPAAIGAALTAFCCLHGTYSAVDVRLDRSYPVTQRFGIVDKQRGPGYSRTPHSHVLVLDAALDGDRRKTVELPLWQQATRGAGLCTSTYAGALKGEWRQLALCD